MGVKTFLWNKKLSNDQIKFAAKHVLTYCIVYELQVKRVVTFEMVLYHNQ